MQFVNNDVNARSVEDYVSQIYRYGDLVFSIVVSSCFIMHTHTHSHLLGEIVVALEREL